MGKDSVKLYQLGYDSATRQIAIDRETNFAISQKYSIEDEIKLLRRALAGLGCKDPDFLSWHTFAESAINDGASKKAKIPKQTNAVIADHDETKFKPGYPVASINPNKQVKRAALKVP